VHVLTAAFIHAKRAADGKVQPFSTNRAPQGHLNFREIGLIWQIFRRWPTNAATTGPKGGADRSSQKKMAA
jgi:hypothetical protein